VNQKDFSAYVYNRQFAGDMHPIRLAVDVASGDFGTRVLLEGVLEARQFCKYRFITHLCGDRSLILENLKKLGCEKDLSDSIVIEHCPQQIDDDETPSRVWKTKRLAPVVRCVSMQKDGLVDASLSAGDTRILLTAAIFLLGRMEMVVRPALAAFIPSISTRPTLLLDVGANLGCRTEHLAAFGRMGFLYYRRFFGVDCPRVALLNIGREPSKGTRTIIEAGEELDKTCKGYCGFVEGGSVLTGDVDVVVCDGFAGNVLLKTCERFHALAESVLGDGGKLDDTVRKKIAVLNPENYGGVPLLGIRGVVFKAHGSSSSRAFAHALAASVTAVHRGLPAM
jgi:glycerol-3-phosphate acyltransferase PlsX